MNCTWWSEDGEPGPPPPPTSFVPDTGSVVFDGIMVSRESEEVCDTVFNCTEQHHAFTIHDVTCNIPLKGCAEGFRVNDDDADYRTCVEGMTLPAIGRTSVVVVLAECLKAISCCCRTDITQSKAPPMSWTR